MSSFLTSTWGTWQQTRNTLVQTLSMNIEGRNRAAPGSSDALAYARSIDQNLSDLQDHALTGLRQINDDLGNSSYAKDLKTTSERLKREADRLRNIASKVDDLTKLTAKLTKLVVGFKGL